MAAGRGEFFQSFSEGLQRLPGQPAAGGGPQGRGRGNPGAARQQEKPDKRRATGKRRKKHPKTGPPRTGDDPSGPKTTPKPNKTSFHKVKRSSPDENIMERLPHEILIKILSYLDASSLFCISHVSKLFHHLANDNVMWHKLYMSEFGRHMWKPNAVDDTVTTEAPLEAADRLLGHWKKMYFKTVAGQEINKWRRELRDVSPYTGLPRQTELVLRNLNVRWELTVCDCWGQESTLEQSRAYFFESSVIIRWSKGNFTSYHHISSIQLHGVRSPKVRPDWRSLILKLDMKTQSGRFIGKDELIKLMHLSPGVIIGIWRGQSNVAFIMICLHFHKLVEKSLLGSPACPYSETVEKLPMCNSEDEFVLHDYTLHFVLHNTGTQIMSGHFRQLCFHPVQMHGELLELRVINTSNLSQHRSLSGGIKLLWKSEELEGSVENCCIMSLTLLDDFQKPFWCVSSPVRITMSKRSLSFRYSGEHFVMEYRSPDGKVKMKLVRLNEEKQFFLISLAIYVSVVKVNKHFSGNC